jgi:hypothetical protein
LTPRSFNNVQGAEVNSVVGKQHAAGVGARRRVRLEFGAAQGGIIPGRI